MTACAWLAFKSLYTQEQATYKSQLHARLAKVDVHLLDLLRDTGRNQNTIQEVVDHAVTSPLTENGNTAITCQAIARSAMFEQRAVVPPALIATVHIKVLLVLVDLHGNPDAVLPASTVVFSKNLPSLRVPTTSVEPARRLRKKPCQTKNQGREENLHPDGHDPTHVAFKTDGATSDTSSKNRADKPIVRLESKRHTMLSDYLPECVVETSNDTTVGRVCGLDNVQRSSGGNDRYTESKQQTTAHELPNSAATRLCGSLNDNTCTGNGTANNHAIPATPGIASRSDKGKSNNTADLIHRSDDTGPGTSRFDPVVGFESVVCKKRVEHGTIKPVASGAEEANNGANV